MKNCADVTAAPTLASTIGSPIIAAVIMAAALVGLAGCEDKSGSTAFVFAGSAGTGGGGAGGTQPLSLRHRSPVADLTQTCDETVGDCDDSPSWSRFQTGYPGGDYGLKQ